MPEALTDFTARAESAGQGRQRAIMFQNCYSENVRDKLDPAFVPLDGTRNARTDYREVALFLRLYHAGRHKAAEYTGVVSPKFGEKTNISGAEFLSFVERNPGFDVYFINPYPINAYYSLNVWEHGEIMHPGLMILAQELLDRAGIACDVAAMGRNSQSSLLYCNYWMGNERFWDRFMDLNLRVLHAAEMLPARMRERLFALDPLYPDPVPILPFVFERLFSTFLLLDRTTKGCPYPHSREYVLRCREGSDEPIIAASVMDLIDEIDRRGEYDARDMAVFRAIQSLKRRLYGRVIPQ